jgi:hypothetical protein
LATGKADWFNSEAYRVFLKTPPWITPEGTRLYLRTASEIGFQVGGDAPERRILAVVLAKTRPKGDVSRTAKRKSSGIRRVAASFPNRHSREGGNPLVFMP